MQSLSTLPRLHPAPDPNPQTCSIRLHFPDFLASFQLGLAIGRDWREIGREESERSWLPLSILSAPAAFPAVCAATLARRLLSHSPAPARQPLWRQLTWVALALGHLASFTSSQGPLYPREAVASCSHECLGCLAFSFLTPCS